MHLRHYLGLLAVALAWGFNFAVVKIGLGHWPPLLFVAIRFIAVALALSPFLRRLPRSKLLQVALLSVTLGVLQFGMIFAVKQLEVLHGIFDVDDSADAVFHVGGSRFHQFVRLPSS